VRIADVRGGKDQTVRGNDQDRMTGATSQQRIPIDTRLSASITSDDHVQGPIDAAVTLVQYGDYECPHTRMPAQTDFWRIHEYLFEHQNALAESDLHNYALELRLDAVRFEHDRRTSNVRERVDRDLATGEASGVLCQWHSS